MSFTLRQATLADLDTLIYHRYAMWRDMGRPAEVLEAVNAAAREYFQSELPNGRYVGWFAETEGKIVGGAGVVISPWPGSPGSTLAKRAMILNVFVEPDFRRRGIARSLMLAVIEWCKIQGFPAVGLHASDEGRPLYAALGFQPTNEMQLRF